MKYFIEDILRKIDNQGDAFMSNNDYLEGGIEYWKYKLKHEKD